MRITANEFVLPFREGWQCHASSLEVLKDGRIFCVFFYGTREGASDVRIFGSFRSPDGIWSEAVPLSEEDGVAHWNPVLFRRKDGAIVLYYKVSQKISRWRTFCRISYDECETWSESFEMVPGDESGGRGPVRNKPIYLSDGSILAPGSTEKDRWKCFFDRSFDEGVTWQRSEDLCIPVPETRHGIIQPTLWESESGIHALMRSTENRIYRTDSKDGTHWTEPRATDLPNNNSAIDLAKLPDGRIFLVCNPTEGNMGPRTPLSLFESTDDGETFHLYSHLITMAGKYAYPCVVYENGNLHISYTWNRRTIQYFCLTDL